jgi:hypothetical protein
MNILETLHLRMAGGDLDEIVDQVRKATGHLGPPPFVSIFRHSKVEGDLLVQIVRDDLNQKGVPSELGIGLAALLRTYGLVEHSVWVSAEVPAGGNQAVSQKEDRR